MRGLILLPVAILWSVLPRYEALRPSLVASSSKVPPTKSDRRRFVARLTIGFLGISTAVIQRQPAVAAADEIDTTSDAVTTPSIVDSSSGTLKPFAPVSALLPATRAKLWIQEAYQISSKLTVGGSFDNTKPQQQQYEILKELDDVLSHRPKLFAKGEKLPQRVGSKALAQFTARKESPGAYKSATRTSASSPSSKDPFATSPSLGEQFSTALNRADVARQWGILQAQESRSESQNELRAAWNYYTQQLEFNPSSYEWNASVEEKRKRIRNDQLPTPQAVIVSDLDLRDLYRNQMLTALDDATAEVKYQLKQQGNENTGERIDVSDTVELMNQAYVACTKWFDMIDQKDVQEAEVLVRKEQQDKGL